MSTIATLLVTDDVPTTGLTNINDNFSALNTDKAEKSGDTFTGDISVPDEAYGVGWNGSLEVPTKNAIYDKIQALPVLSDGDKGDITVSSSGSVYTIDNDAVTFAKMQNIAGDRLLGRVSGVSGDVGEVTGTQINTILPDATTSLGGRMSSTDKTKLDLFSSTGVPPFSGAKLTHSTSQTLSADAWTSLLWNTEAYDIGNYYISADNRFVAPFTGYFLVTCQTYIGSNSGEVALSIRVNSADTIMSNTKLAGINSVAQVTGVVKLTSGDIVNTRAYLSGTSGNSRDVTSTNSFFSISSLGI